MMKFEWDAKKSRLNKEKHGIDFETSKNLWLDEDRIEIAAPHPVENRNIIIGEINNKLWAGIYAVRGDKIRIISVRRVRKKEAQLYEKKAAR
ncbi:MAG: BrnT family toxin [Proteobacteria bacterium]|nr:BrnT family toxin [Pseudomonadota bacterium]